MPRGGDHERPRAGDRGHLDVVVRGRVLWGTLGGVVLRGLHDGMTPLGWICGGRRRRALNAASF